MRKQKDVEQCEACGHKHRNVKKCHMCERVLSNNFIESSFLWCSKCGYVLCKECAKLAYDDDTIFFGPCCEKCIESYEGYITLFDPKIY